MDSRETSQASEQQMCRRVDVMMVVYLSGSHTATYLQTRRRHASAFKFNITMSKSQHYGAIAITLNLSTKSYFFQTSKYLNYINAFACYWCFISLLTNVEISLIHCQNQEKKITLFFGKQLTQQLIPSPCCRVAIATCRRPSQPEWSVWMRRMCVCRAPG